MEVSIVFMLMMFSGSVLSDGKFLGPPSGSIIRPAPWYHVIVLSSKSSRYAKFQLNRLMISASKWSCKIPLHNELLKPCDTTDIHCLSQSTEKFLGQTHKGIREYNIVPIDPLVISSLDIVFASEGITYKNTNLTITGLKNQKISDFKMDTKAKSVVLTTQADLNMVSDLIVFFTKSSKSLPGYYTSRGSVLGTATYNYELVTRNGTKYFDVGPETITCEVVSTPKVELNNELSKTLANDVDAKAFSEEKRTELIERAFCKAVEEAYKHVVHNIRAAAKFLPASAFFKNI